MRIKSILCVAAMAGTSLAIPASHSTAQGIGQAITNQLGSGQLGSGQIDAGAGLNAGANATLQNRVGDTVGDAVRSGIDAATDQVRRGDSIRGAIGEGTRQAIRQGVDQATGQVLPNVNTRMRQRARLGIGLQNTDQGIRITNVTQGSAAAQAGLQAGDVVVSANGQAITSTDQLARIVRNADSNAQLNMNVMRNGQQQAVTATLAARQNQNDRYTARKPAIDGSANASAQYEARIKSLEDEVQQLRATIDELRGNYNRDQGGSADSQNRATQNNADVNLEGSAELDASADQTSAETSGSVDADAALDSGLDVDASGSASTDASLDNPLDN
ncbi:Putative serine protease HtrA [Stieleria maiorica]|uniref:Serine protease HtrA n=1 Tax=Stieleria maiorica TaxID=2795974 RepID=A0A5B9ML72_9BACT|nr:PDZ domain-containing protein [Stieleria maiorica]QEG00435.1 Putative serine protease HtrA [Stieleria maiorica]